MTQSAIPLLSQYLRCLRTGYSDSSSDHELLQRFVACREEAAFAVLVQRHAAMVLGLSRSILRNHHDAEDIFQATFLVLARKAGSIRKGESVGSWLYAVAHRLAHKARVNTGKRRHTEQQAAVPTEQMPMDEATWGELRDILHEEVSRLPEKYRAAVVLCYWQGQTHEQAGQQLGCARGTIKDRLEKAREILRKRLTRRGLALSAAWIATSLSEGMSATVSAELVQTTVRGAMLFSVERLPTGIVSATAADRAQDILKEMLTSKFKYGLVLVLMLGLLGGGAGLASRHETTTPENEPEVSAAAATRSEPEHIERQEEPLPAGAVARLGTLGFRHADTITHIAAGRDGRSILSAAGNEVYIWELATGKERRRYPHKSPVTSCIVSGDGKLLASGCRDGTIHLWDTISGRELRHFMAHKRRSPNEVSESGAFVGEFTPDGRQIVSMGAVDNTIRLWDVASGEKIREFGHFPPYCAIAMSPDGKILAGAVKNEETWELRLWEVATGRERQRKPLPGKQILSPTFSPDSKMLAIAVGENWQKPCDIQLWDTDRFEPIRTLRGHKKWAWCSFAPDGKTLISWSVDGTARLWQAATGEEIGRVGGDSPVYARQFLFCPDGRTLASFWPSNHSPRFWDRASGQEVRSFGGAISSIDFLRFSPDGRLLAAGSKGDVVIRIWDVAAHKIVRRMEHGGLTALQFSPDGKRLASAAYTDEQVRIWNVANGKELRRISANKAGRPSIDCMTWSGNGNTLATWSYGGPIRTWDAETGKQVREWNTGMERIETLVFSPDSKVLAALGNDNGGQYRRTFILRCEVDTGRSLPSIEEPRLGLADLGTAAHARLAFSPDGRTLAAGGNGREPSSILLWEMVSGCIRLTLQPREEVASLTFSPDGKLLAAANSYDFIQDGGILSPPPRVHLWDMAAEKELPSLEGHRGSITSLSFSPDAKLLATGSNDTTVLLWDATRFTTTRPAEVELRPQQLRLLWADLGGTDAVKAYRAIRTMAASPKASIVFLKQQLRSVAPEDAKLVARLLADLDSDQFAVRDKAMQELEKLGDRAATELRKALDRKPTLEVKRRIEQLLEKQQGAEHIRVVRALETLEEIGTSEARELCTRLADGVPDAAMTREAQATLKRMTR
jgi:RNA polymerase sigma factor (sigma-70 family)